MKNIFRKTNSPRGGYTIIETMIAISLFLIIVTVGIGALLNANSLHKKSGDMRSIIDNLNFVMEDMSKNLRTGTNYHCIDANNPSLVDTTPRSCQDGGGGISFKAFPSTNQFVYYIGTYNGNSGIWRSVDGAGTFVNLLAGDITIDSLSSGFFVLGAEPPPEDLRQPFVTIKLVGTINYKDIITPFSLQTAVSQRQIDI